MPASSPWWHPERHADRQPFLLSRARIKSAIRAWFEARGFTEVDTACLQVSPGNETHLQAFETELIGPGARAPHALSPHLARVRHEEAPRGRRGEDLHVRPRVSQSRAWRAPPSRVHDARVVSGPRALCRGHGRRRGTLEARGRDSRQSFLLVSRPHVEPPRRAGALDGRRRDEPPRRDRSPLHAWPARQRSRSPRRHARWPRHHRARRRHVVRSLRQRR